MNFSINLSFISVSSNICIVVLLSSIPFDHSFDHTVEVLVVKFHWLYFSHFGPNSQIISKDFRNGMLFWKET